MRRLLPLLLCLCAAALTACQKEQTPVPQEPITLFPPRSETQAELPDYSPASVPAEVPATTRLTANDSYGETHTLLDAQPVLDECADFRTADSYRFEAAAVEHARLLFRDDVPLPDTLRVTNVCLNACFDDGRSVYYCLSLEGNYALQSGERIERSVFYDLGVRKKNGDVFDAQMQILEIEDKYSLLLPKGTELSFACGEESEALDALVPKLLKDASQSKILSVTAVPDRPHVYTVLCEGVNDYGIAIRQTRDVELVEQENGWTLCTAAESF